ncbi:nitroreductase family protein [Bacteroides sp. 51]|uniref:nitroreductase family protein n=1 Tax=Bacteroides sp. 51 TaxID=2302938 RepID=UPI0013CF96A1|nr:nitroreductase family protein [Bacteroides sp. 51]NDV80465.1 nitroreductase family protein [Bacteroides sp. 51]
MKRSFVDALANRRSHYAISPKSPISDKEIENIVATVLTHVPSAFNSQTTRMVLLLGENHLQLWEIVKATLKERISAEAFVQTEAKIDNSFASGYGTILFFEEQEIVEYLQKSFPSYKDNFPVWSQHTSAMHQLATWVMLEDAGFGASLQHYNPLIDAKVLETWNLPKSWTLVAQMPFGLPTGEIGEKEMDDLNKRMKVFK